MYQPPHLYILVQAVPGCLPCGLVRLIAVSNSMARTHATGFPRTRDPPRGVSISKPLLDSSDEARRYSANRGRGSDKNSRARLITVDSIDDQYVRSIQRGVVFGKDVHESVLFISEHAPKESHSICAPHRGALARGIRLLGVDVLVRSILGVPGHVAGVRPRRGCRQPACVPTAPDRHPVQRSSLRRGPRRWTQRRWTQPQRGRPQRERRRWQPQQGRYQRKTRNVPAAVLNRPPVSLSPSKRVLSVPPRNPPPVGRCASAWHRSGVPRIVPASRCGRAIRRFRPRFLVPGKLPVRRPPHVADPPVRPSHVGQFPDELRLRRSGFRGSRLHQPAILSPIRGHRRFRWRLPAHRVPPPVPLPVLPLAQPPSSRVSTPHRVREFAQYRWGIFVVFSSHPLCSLHWRSRRRVTPLDTRIPLHDGKKRVIHPIRHLSFRVELVDHRRSSLCPLVPWR